MPVPSIRSENDQPDSIRECYKHDCAEEANGFFLDGAVRLKDQGLPPWITISGEGTTKTGYKIIFHPQRVDYIPGSNHQGEYRGEIWATLSTTYGR